MNRSFWAGRRVFLTGHTGFKGSWAAVLLAELGAEVTGFSLSPPTSPALFELAGVASLCTDLRGDIRDRVALASAVTAAQPEVVIHMAAQPLVRESYANPVDTYAINVMGTLHLLEASRATSGIRSIVAVTTDKCYQNNGWVWGYREVDRLGGADPYSSSKAACELLVQSYRSSYFSASGAHLATARAGNVIGGGDFACDRLIPDAVRAFGTGEALLIRNPRAVRPWQHVLEPLAGYLLLAEQLYARRELAAAWNFGPSPEQSTSVEQVIDLAAAHWGFGAAWVQDDRFHPHEAATLKLDSTKAMTDLGWKPLFSLDEAVQATMEWYVSARRGDDMVEFTRRQVHRYLALVQGEAAC